MIIVADDLGWGAVSHHADWCETPNIDRIAREGNQLERFYTAPMCSPTRAGLLTGRYPIRFGMARSVIGPHRKYGLPKSEKPLGDWLAEAGYQHRGIFGKWHLGHHLPQWHPLQRGFTKFEGHYNGNIDYFKLMRDGQRDWHEDYQPSTKQGYATNLIGEAAASFIRESAPQEAPYFCYVPFNAPHSPFQAPDQAINRYCDPSETPRPVDKYRAMVWSMDRSIGKILDAVDNSGEADNTQIWFFSDNGGVGQFAKNNAPLRGHKSTAFEGGTRVVACVKWPKAWPGGRKIDAPIGYIDVLPTVVASAGVSQATLDSASNPLDGINLCAVLEGNQQSVADREWYTYQGQNSEDKEWISVRTSQWKLVVHGPDVRRGNLTDQHRAFLFAADDLLEQHDLLEQNPAVVERLYAKLQAYRALQPKDGVPVYGVGREGFQPWQDWNIKH